MTGRVMGGLGWLALATEICRLAHSGLAALDIGAALRLDLGFVLEALQDAERGRA